MKFHKQLFRHRPEDGQFGDCHRTCIAILLDKEPQEVPNFGEHYDDAEAFQTSVNDYLRSQGLTEYAVAYMADRVEDLLKSLDAQMPNLVFILGGTSTRGLHHSVIAGHGKILWDPFQDDRGDSEVMGPCSDGFYWVTVLVPLFHKVPKHEIQEN